MRYFWPKRGTCGLNHGDVGLVDGWLQRREAAGGAKWPGGPKEDGGGVGGTEDETGVG